MAENDKKTADTAKRYYKEKIVMKFKILLPLLFLLLAGCNGMSEPNGQFMANSLGFERDGKQISAYIQAVDVTEGEQNGNPATFVVKGEGDTVKEAINDTRSKLSKELSLKHTELIILSDNLEKEDFGRILELSEQFDVSLRVKIASSLNIKALLEDDGVSGGLGLVTLIKQNAASAGFGGHTALFEIKTAYILGEDFALPHFSSDAIGIEGLYYYKEGIPTSLLSFEESIRYAKERNLYEGE